MVLFVFQTYFDCFFFVLLLFTMSLMGLGGVFTYFFIYWTYSLSRVDTTCGII